MSSDKRLSPGFRQVDAFDPDDNYERDEQGEIIEEISYVTLDLGPVEPSLVPSSSTYRLIGLDTPTPFLQLSGTIFQGTHQSLLGTELLFAEDKELHDQTKRKITHVANTSQRIRFKQIDVRPKGAPPESPLEPSTRGKGKGASSKQKANPVDNVNILDSITGNVEQGDLPLQSRRRKGKGKDMGADESQALQRSQSMDGEQAAVLEETSSMLEAAMES